MLGMLNIQMLKKCDVYHTLKNMLEIGGRELFIWVWMKSFIKINIV